ncbi:MAG: nickel-responsive transcriptional regulator NikR [Candidatus Hodarchaeota archaeon]
MTESGVARISISLPPLLLDELDEVTREIGLDRSKALQQAIRDLITNHRLEYKPTARGVGTVTLLYHHDVPGLETELTDIQHHHTELITSTTHIHLDGHHCLLVIVVKGQASQIHQLAITLQGLRGIRQIKLTLLTTSE